MSCPICEEETVTKFRPFCSKRCADIDLAKWLNGSYAVPSQREEDVETEVSDPKSDQQRPH
ncbi:DNA gyrase inhibitor YacG [Ruegeria atlantica]|uniref:DNA gyrase inhibitor YacG n=1 Tax=Ruegeria atlantica TaxID=81569 RepID=UPI00147E11D0|nr:DNA gyrase inhibitor YacG [Ruegeria atlantica]